MSVTENLMMATTSRKMRLRVPSRSLERAETRDLAATFGIVAASPDVACSTLSGGNQQKVVIAKWMRGSPRVLLMDEPTRGVDVGAKREIYRLLADARAEGVGILVSSSETEELLLLCDRILVMVRGRIVASLDRAQATEGERRALLDGGGVTSASDVDTVSAATPGRLARVVSWSASNQYVGVLLVLVCLVIVFSVQEPRFLTVANIRVMLTGVAILWMISLGLTVVMLTGGFDLSLGSMLALSGFIFVGFYLHLGVPALAAVMLTVVAGALIGGLVNGLLIGWVGMPFLVVTIGTLSLYQGITYLVSNGQTTSLTSSLLDSIGFGTAFGVPIAVWIMIGTLIARCTFCA